MNEGGRSLPSVEELVPGFDPKHVLPDVLSPSTTQYPNAGEILKAFREIPALERPDKPTEDPAPETPPAPDAGN